jgi:hypothetical protein
MEVLLSTLSNRKRKDHESISVRYAPSRHTLVLTKTVEQSRIEVVLVRQHVPNSHFANQNLQDAGGKQHPLWEQFVALF